MPKHSEKKISQPNKNSKIKSHRRYNGFKTKHKHKQTALRDKLNKLRDSSTPKLDMSAWDSLSLPPPLISALRDLKFSSPTPIQLLSIPPALHSHVIGAAETGSGKTLAFGLPILSHLIREDVLPPVETMDHGYEGTEGGEGCVRWVDNIPDSVFDKMLSDPLSPAAPPPALTSPPSQQLQALVLSPTRELCLQISSHLRAAAVHTDVQVVSVVGGMSVSKQTRLLSRCPQVVVSTPGRYLQLAEEGGYCSQLSGLKFLVIDEVDRMLTDGHFANIGLIFSRIPALSGQGGHGGLQVFLFSATVPACFLSLKRCERGEQEGIRTLKRFISQGSCKVVNLTRKEVLVESLTEERLVVESSSKIFYLYYLLRRKGKVLVFANSISTLRQLYGILSMLGLSLLVVHSGMQQKQRLKCLDQFAASSEGILLASDIAARGIDFRDVSDIIHFHVPATAQLYVHRCGRTARTRHKDGRSLLLVSPEESKRYLSICKNLEKLKAIPVASITVKEVFRFKESVQLAVKLNKLENSHRRESKDKSWEKRASSDLHGDDEVTSSDEDAPKPSAKQYKIMMREGKDRLKGLLSNIGREEVENVSYWEGLRYALSASGGAEAVGTRAVPYIPLIREKHRKF